MPDLSKATPGPLEIGDGSPRTLYEGPDVIMCQGDNGLRVLAKMNANFDNYPADSRRIVEAVNAYDGHIKHIDALEMSLAHLVTIVEMDPEASDPSTDLWAAIKVAESLLRKDGSNA